MGIENNPLYRFGPFRIDTAERRLSRDGKIVKLRPKAFDLLLELVRTAGHIQTRETLIRKLWPDTIVEEQGLTVSVSTLRKALGDEGEPARYIETVRGQGYRFIAPVTTEAAETGPQTAPGRDKPRLVPAVAIAAFAVLVAVAGFFIWHGFFRGPAGGPASPAPTRSIAVLPFENLSTNPANAYFAAGIQDTILTKLSGIADLRVISRTSTEHYPSHPQNLDKVARELGVATVLEGSVQKSGNQVLVNVQLIDAATDSHIWAQAYTRRLDNVFAVESDIAEQVAAALKTRLLPQEKARIARAPTQNPKAYLLFLKANYVAAQVKDKKNTRNPADASKQAETLYRQAIALDPGFALDWAHLSYLESYTYWYILTQAPQQMHSAEQAAKRALALDPGLPEAHIAMGYVYYYGHRDYAAALEQFEQAGKTLSNDAAVIAAVAYIHRRQGEWKQALAGLRQASILDPRNPRWLYDTGFMLMALYRYPAAEQQFDRALAVEPRDYDARAFKALALLFAGQSSQQAEQVLAGGPTGGGPRGMTAVVRFEAAWLAHRPAAALSALAAAPDWILAPDAIGQMPTSLLRAKAWAAQGKTAQAKQAYEKARDTLHDALHSRPKNPNLWSFLGLAEAGLGQKEAAIRAGRKATILIPVEKDALSGIGYLAVLAKIHAQLDQAKPAVRLLKRLLAMPAGFVLSVPLLKRDPAWDPIRHDPAFQALLKRHATASSSVATQTRTPPASSTRAPQFP